MNLAPTMRVLLISDIHSNLVALEAVLRHARAYDQVWCLGDVVGYGPAPNECIERIALLPLLCLGGNHDWAVAGLISDMDFNADARRAVRWTQEVLAPANLEWLRQRPDHLKLPEQDVTLVHGSPRDPIWEYILSTQIAAENMSYFDTPVCLCGHTHVPANYHSEESGQVKGNRPEPGEAVRWTSKTLLNPGSVGQPRDRDPRAAYAVLDVETQIMTGYRVEYDIAATQAAMRAAGLPPRLSQRLEFGV